MSMTTGQAVITIAAVVLGTMTTRFLPFLLFFIGENRQAELQFKSVSPRVIINCPPVSCMIRHIDLVKLSGDNMTIQIKSIAGIAMPGCKPSNL